MTLNEFFRKVRHGREWRIEWNGQVRCSDGRCPLGAADDDLVDVPSWKGAEKLLGLAPGLASKIAKAADHRTNRHRPWLLKNLGMPVPSVKG